MIHAVLVTVVFLDGSCELKLTWTNAYSWDIGHGTASSVGPDMSLSSGPIYHNNGLIYTYAKDHLGAV